MQKLFYPRCVAVIGASDNPNNMGRNIIENLRTWGYSGKVYPVNPKGGEVFGLRVNASLEDIEEPIDLAVAFVPAKVVPEVMDQCARKGITRMAIPSGGFSELGEEGRRLTRLIQGKAEEYGIRFVGPNGLTIINAENGLCLPFTTMRKRNPGYISLISQSGGVGLSLIMFLDNEGRCFNKFISVGNKVNLDEVDFLEYLGDDPGTQVIAMFIESVERGREFLEVAEKIEKPILVYKANRTEAGALTAVGHTAALSNDDLIIDSAFRQAGVFRVDEIKHLVSLSKVFELPPMRGNRLAVISQAGGYAVLTADEAERHGFNMADFSEGVLESLKQYVRADVIKLGNPLDLGDIHSSDAIVFAVDTVLSQPGVDGVALVLLRRSDSKYTGGFIGLRREVYSDIGELIEKHKKPVALTLITQRDYLDDVRSRMDFPVFDEPEEAVAGLAMIRDYSSRIGENAKRVIREMCC